MTHFCGCSIVSFEGDQILVLRWITRQFESSQKPWGDRFQPFGAVKWKVLIQSIERHIIHATWPEGYIAWLSPNKVLAGTWSAVDGGWCQAVCLAWIRNLPTCKTRSKQIPISYLYISTGPSLKARTYKCEWSWRRRRMRLDKVCHRYLVIPITWRRKKISTLCKKFLKQENRADIW